jgi:uncharacterized membrane protein
MHFIWYTRSRDLHICGSLMTQTLIIECWFIGISESNNVSNTEKHDLSNSTIFGICLNPTDFNFVFVHRCIFILIIHDFDFKNKMLGTSCTVYYDAISKNRNVLFFSGTQLFLLDTWREAWSRFESTTGHF